MIDDKNTLLKGKIQGIDGPTVPDPDRVIGRHKMILCQQDNDYVFPQTARPNEYLQARKSNMSLISAGFMDSVKTLYTIDLPCKMMTETFWPTESRWTHRYKKVVHIADK
jgi:hypothetical protein